MLRARLIAGTGILVMLLIAPSTARAADRATVTAAGALAELRRTATITGTAWWVDPAHGGVVVSADPVRGGGDLFFGAGMSRCTVGFNVRRLPTYYFLTSAHCVGPVGSTVYADPNRLVVLGVVASVDSGHDYALVRYTNTTIAKPSAVNLYNGTLRAITSVSAGFVGQAVMRAGNTTGVRSGTITALNVTVNFAGGTVTNLIRTTVCAEPGDSGGPLFAGSIALGMTTGGSGNCSTGGTTYFSSAARAMSQYTVGVY